MVLHELPSKVIESWNNLLTRAPKSSFKRKLRNSMFFVVTWTIWYERNLVKFQNKSFSFPKLVWEIKLRLAFWIKIFAPRFPYSTLQVAENLQAIWNWAG